MVVATRTILEKKGSEKKGSEWDFPTMAKAVSMVRHVVALAVVAMREATNSRALTRGQRRCAWLGLLRLAAGCAVIRLPS